MHNLSDEVLCARWIENPYYQHFCGELSFCHRLPFDRSSMTRWRQRLGEEQLVALIQESLSVAHKTGAIGPKDLERVAVDTTVQPKAVAHPTDARLMHRAITKLVVGLAKRNRVPLRQSYLRLAKRAAVMVGRYTHAHQFKRARRQLKFLRTRLGRIIRDTRRKIDGDAVPATTSACSCGGSQNSCVPSSGPCRNCPGSKDRLNQRSSAFFTEDKLLTNGRGRVGSFHFAEDLFWLENDDVHRLSSRKLYTRGMNLPRLFCFRGSANYSPPAGLAKRAAISG